MAYLVARVGLEGLKRIWQQTQCDDHQLAARFSDSGSPLDEIEARISASLGTTPLT